MNSQLIVLFCAFLWGISTFLNRISCQHLSSKLLQCVTACCFIFYIPIACKLEGVNPFTYNWNVKSVILTIIATIISIFANVLLYIALKDNKNSGNSVMLVSLYPVITMLLCTIFFHEQLSLLKILGVISMIIGTILLSI